MTYLTKQDWLDLKKSSEIGLRNSEVAKIQHEQLLEICLQKIKEIEDKEIETAEKELGLNEAGAS